MMSDFLVNGFYHTNSQMRLRLLDKEEFDWKDMGEYKVANLSKHSMEFLDYIQYIIGQDYVSKVCHKFEPTSIDVINGVDNGTKDWHNDLIEGEHIAVLCYLSDTDETTGGYTEFRSTQTGEVTGKFYPKKYDICMINHSEGWQHRVEPLKKDVDRIAINFGYKIC